MKTPKTPKLPNSYQLRTWLLSDPDPRQVQLLFVLCLLASARAKARAWIVLALLVAVAACYFVPGMVLVAALIAFYLVRPLTLYAVIGKVYWTIRR